MGKNDKPSFKERKLVTAIGAACCVASLILSSAALGTDNWFTSTGYANAALNASETSLSVNYGLFKGSKEVNAGLSKNTYNVQFVCSAEANSCMWSCAGTNEERYAELEQLLRTNYTGTLPFCTPVQQKSKYQKFSVRDSGTGDNTDNKRFMDFGLWVTTVIFLCLMVLFEIIASVFCLLNVFINPIEIWTGPMAIYTSTAISSFGGILAMALWGGQFGNNLSINAAVTETLTGKWIQDSAALGLSFWLVLAAALLNICCCLCIRFRNILRKSGGIGTEEDEPTPNGVVLLF